MNKLIRLFIALALCMVGNYAWADYPAVKAYTYTGSSVYNADPQKACNDYAVGNGFVSGTAVEGFSGAGGGGGPGTYICNEYRAGGVVSTSANSTSKLTCPYGGTLNNTTCVGANICTAGKVEDVWAQAYLVAGRDIVPSPPVSDGTCRVIVSSMKTCIKALSSGVIACQFSVTQAGDVLAADANWQDGPSSPSGNTTGANVPPFKSSSCPTGTVQGGSDSSGTPICIGTGTNPSTSGSSTTTQSPTTTTTNSDGSTTSVSSISSSNSDGSTTTTTTTIGTSPAGIKTITIKTDTTPTPSGGAGKPDPGTPAAAAAQPAQTKDLCQANPTLSICRNSSVTGGCGSLTCSGDAVQCATLQATQKMECAHEKDQADLAALPSTTLGSSILGGNDPMAGQIQSTVKGDTVDMSKSNLDQTGFIGAGSCIPDKTFTVSGKSVTVSFSSLCTNIQPLRFVIMSCAFLVAYLMVSRSVISG